MMYSTLGIYINLKNYIQKSYFFGIYFSVVHISLNFGNQIQSLVSPFQGVIARYDFYLLSPSVP